MIEIFLKQAMIPIPEYTSDDIKLFIESVIWICGILLVLNILNLFLKVIINFRLIVLNIRSILRRSNGYTSFADIQDAAGV